MQVPLFLGVFAAVRRGLSGSGRFLWGRDLTASDPFAGMYLRDSDGNLGFSGPECSRVAANGLHRFPAALTLLFLWRISAGVAIYSFSYSLVGVAQSLLIRRHAGKIMRSHKGHGDKGSAIKL